MLLFQLHPLPTRDKPAMSMLYLTAFVNLPLNVQFTKYYIIELSAPFSSLQQLTVNRTYSDNGVCTLQMYFCLSNTKHISSTFVWLLFALSYGLNMSFVQVEWRSSQTWKYDNVIVYLEPRISQVAVVGPNMEVLCRVCVQCQICDWTL